MRILFLSLFCILFLIPTQQQGFLDSCDVQHPFRLLTRMSGKALYASGQNLVLDYVSSVHQTTDSDRWVSCSQNGVSYCKNVVTGTYLSYNTVSQALEASATATTQIDFDEWNSVPGYTLIKVQCPQSNCVLAYESDLLHLSQFDTEELWAHWNKQPLDPIGFRVVDDCNTAFVIQNRGSGLFLTFGNVYPYDGAIVAHYGSYNWLVYNTCPYKINDFQSKLWVLCNGVLRTKHQLGDSTSSPGYYYIRNDVIRVYSGFAKQLSSTEATSAAFVDLYSSPGDILIKMNLMDPQTGPTPELRTFYFYQSQSTGGCGGESFARNIDPNNAEYYKWNFLDPNQPYNW